MIASIGERLSHLFGDNYFWNTVFLDNKIKDYLVFLILFILLFAVLQFFKKVFLYRAKKLFKKTKNKIDDILILAIDSINPLLYWYIALFLSINTLNVHPFVRNSFRWLLLIWISYQVVLIVQIFIDYLIDNLSGREDSSGRKTAISNFGKFIKIAVWLMAGLFILSNLGINVTSVMAGLGIGGIAIAFALQNILSDLFSSFAIYFDKPFVVGDFIIVDKYSGVVEKIGIKSTRIRALQGEEIVISNKELTNTRIQNFKKLQKRRVVFNIGVIYGTPTKTLKIIPEIITEIIDSQKLSEPERVTFSKFADSALNFEITYYILSSDFGEYMKAHEEILFGIREEFEKNKIDMAFPTQTIVLKNNR